MNDRRLAMMQIIDARKKFTARELAERFKVSIRTIQRDLDYLQQIGFPLYTELGPHGGYRVLENRILPPLQLNQTEALGLFLMIELLAKVPDFPFDTIRSHLHEQYYGSLPADVQDNIDRLRHHIAFNEFQGMEPAPFTTTILEAAISKHEIEFHYLAASGRKEYTAFPFGIYFENGYWYMPAKNHNKVLLFRVDRIMNLEVSENVNHELPSLKEWMKSSDERETTEVLLRFTDFGARLVQNDPVIQPVINNAWKGQVPLEEFPYTARRLLRYGPEVKVVYPEQLREMVVELLKNSLGQYK